MTTPGELRHRVTIQQKTRTADGGGGGSVDWSAVATVWAKIEPLSAFQRLKAEQLESCVTHQVSIRYRTDVKTGMRIAYDGRYLAIKTVIDDGERGRWLVLSCEETDA